MIADVNGGLVHTTTLAKGSGESCRRRGVVQGVVAAKPLKAEQIVRCESYSHRTRRESQETR